MTQTAKIFKNGRSQAVRLPAEFRFDGDEVFIRRDEATGDVILSEKSQQRKSFEEFLRLLKETEVPDDFLSPEERNQGWMRPDPFGDWGRMTLYMLDTDTIRDLTRGSENIARRMLKEDFANLCISSVTEAEILYGLQRRPRATTLSRTIFELLNALKSYPWGSAQARQYAVSRAAQPKMQGTVAPIDMLIAAHAQSLGATLVSNEERFGRLIPGLIVEDWT